MQPGQWLSDTDAPAPDAELSNGVLMWTGALLDDRHRASHLPGGFEIPQDNNGIRKIGDIDRGLHVAHQPVLRDCQEGGRALPVQILQQLVNVQHEGILLRHRRLVAVEAVDNDGLCLRMFHPVPDPVREFAGRQFGGVDLLDMQEPAFLQLFQVDADTAHPVVEQSQFLVEDKQGGSLAALQRGDGEVYGKEALARAGG
jgi:hypothetical protein